jgi:M6 family metalloprotease-like protein
MLKNLVHCPKKFAICSCLQGAMCSLFFLISVHTFLHTAHSALGLAAHGLQYQFISAAEMKLPLCLAVTFLAALVALAAPSKTSIRGRHGIHADDGPSRRRAGHELDPNENIFIRTVPVPPASTTAAESKPRGIRRALQEELGHRPHPSYLDQTMHYSTERASNWRQRQRSLYHPANETMHNLVLLLRFSDHTERDLPSRADISHLYNSDAADPFAGDVSDIVPTGSVRQVYKVNSHSTFTIETTVMDWITLSKPESYYGNGNNGFTKFKEAIVEALTKLDNGGGGAMGGPPFNFADFDLDEDGSLDGLGILHSGYGAEYGGDECHGAPDKDRIWSHKGGMDEWTSSPEAGGQVVTVNRFYVSSSLRGVCNSNIVRMGVIVHEIGHYLGLPDLYDETFEGKGLGAYDFMSQSWGLDGSGMYPPNLSAWSKVFLGWAKVEVIAYDGTYQTESSATSNKVYKIEAGYPEGEYLLIENRQPIGYDMNMEGGGLAIYHIDDKANAQNNRGYPSIQSNWPKNGKHYQVALLAADGGYDLEKGTNEGDSGDFWHFGSELKELRSGSASHPNTDSYQYGDVTPTGVRIYGFGFSGKSMTFRVEGLGMSAAGAGSADGIAVSLESIMTPNPTPKPSTPKPVTASPSSPPPKQSPVTKVPTGIVADPTLRPPTPKPVTEAPTKKSGKMPVTSRPTMKPAPPSPQPQSTSICANRCLEEISSSLCPPNPWELPGCQQVNVGELCDANGKCGSNQLLNNCPPFDVYRRVDCNIVDVSAMINETTVTTTGVMTTLQPTSSKPTKVPSLALTLGSRPSSTSGITSASSPTRLPSQQLCANLCLEEIASSKCPLTPYKLPECVQVKVGELCDANGGCGSNQTLNNCPPFDVYRRMDCHVVDVIDKTSVTASVATTSGIATTDTSTNVNQNNCPYYPGWYLGLSHCLNDCLQPEFMISNHNYEFDSMEECCLVHYEGKSSCLTEQKKSNFFSRS